VVTRSQGTHANQRRRLDSWKDIATYLSRSLRTVQRWERNFGLPVHRHHHARGSTVHAYASEIDGWWQERDTTQTAEFPQLRTNRRLPVVVLPFSNLSPADDNQHLCDGVTEELINAFAAAGIAVPSWSAVGHVRTLEEAPESIGMASLFVEGSVRRVGRTVRILVRVVDATTRTSRWADSLEATLDDILELEAELAQRVLRACGVNVDISSTRAH
jgi:TolB-like protein